LSVEEILKIAFDIVILMQIAGPSLDEFTDTTTESQVSKSRHHPRKERQS
jgi:hypothetical protein